MSEIRHNSTKSMQGLKHRVRVGTSLNQKHHSSSKQRIAPETPPVLGNELGNDKQGCGHPADITIFGQNECDDAGQEQNAKRAGTYQLFLKDKKHSKKPDECSNTDAH